MTSSVNWNGHFLLAACALLAISCSSGPTEARPVVSDAAAAVTSAAAPAATSVAPPNSPASGGQVGASAGTTVRTTPTTVVDPTSTAPEATTSLPPAATAPPPGVRTAPDCSALDVRDKAALVVWPSVYADDWVTAEAVVRDVGVGGVILMRPRLDVSTLTERIRQLDAASQLGVLIATDEEGGDVQRLVDIEPLASQADVSTTRTPAEAYGLIAAHASVVAGVGVDVVLGPVVDVMPVEGDPPLQTSRFFQGDLGAVVSYTHAYVDAWQSAGLLPILKHFPGHGSASADTHNAAGVTPPLDVLAASDLVPYQQLASSGAGVMLGHLTVPGLTDGVPASGSPQAVSYLREQLGYQDALVLTDALDMAAADGSIPEASVRALVAGADVVLFTSTGRADDVVDAIVAAVSSGRLAAERLDDAATRVLGQLVQRGLGCRPA